MYADVSIKYWLSTFFSGKAVHMYRLWQKYWCKKDLVAHKNAAHDMSEFKGKECSGVFGYETALKRHVRSKHEGKRFLLYVQKHSYL